MQREKRYIVLKCSDVEAAASHGFLNHYQMDSLVAITSRVTEYRQRAKKPTLECVVVESDWPEYEPTWQAIEQRVDGSTPHHGFDNDRQVLFYERDFYVLSNFSAFSLQWEGRRFDTSEAAYHWEKFPGLPLQEEIQLAPSAHEAFKIAEQYKSARRPDWDSVKVGIMRNILRAKAQQHEYVRRKLRSTGDRTLIEDSWRDDFWGWGPKRDGQNMLGRLWMDVRAELREAPADNR
jgi:ribA/ribD-fused uncharacterized protein